MKTSPKKLLNTNVGRLLTSETTNFKNCYQRRKDVLRALPEDSSQYQNLGLTGGVYDNAFSIPEGECSYETTATTAVSFEKFSYLDVVQLGEREVLSDGVLYPTPMDVFVDFQQPTEEETGYLIAQYTANFTPMRMMTDADRQTRQGIVNEKLYFQSGLRKFGTGFSLNDVVRLGNETDGQLEFRVSRVIATKVLEVGPGSSGWEVGDVFRTGSDNASFFVGFVVTETGPSGEILGLEIHPGYQLFGQNWFYRGQLSLGGFFSSETFQLSDLNQNRVFRDGTSWPSSGATLIDVGDRVFPSFVRVSYGVGGLALEKTSAVYLTWPQQATVPAAFKFARENYPSIRRLKTRLRKESDTTVACDVWFSEGNGKGFVCLPEEFNLEFIMEMFRYDQETGQSSTTFFGAPDFLESRDEYAALRSAEPNPNGGDHGANVLIEIASTNFPMTVFAGGREFSLEGTNINFSGGILNSPSSTYEGFVLRRSVLPSIPASNMFFAQEIPFLSSYLLTEQKHPHLILSEESFDKEVTLEPLPAGTYPVMVYVRPVAGINEINGKFVRTSLGDRVRLRSIEGVALTLDEAIALYNDFYLDGLLVVYNPDATTDRFTDLIQDLQKDLTKRGWAR